MAYKGLVVAGMFKRIINRYYYSLESIKNRYPCKIINVKNIRCFDKQTEVQFIAASKVNVRLATPQDILNDALLVEKFHPTDGVKLGFLACGELLLRQNLSLEDIRALYLDISTHMFQDMIK